MDALIAAVASAMNAPEELLRRSAEARSAADESTPEAVLGGWSQTLGLEPMAETDQPTQVVEPVVEPAEPVSLPDEVPIADEAVSSESSEEPELVAVGVPSEPVSGLVSPALDPALVALALEHVPPPEPVTLGQRTVPAIRIGAVIGAVVGLVNPAAANWLDNATVIEQGNGFSSAFEITSSSFVIWWVAVGLVLGAFVALAARTVPAWAHAERAITGTLARSAVVGAAVGAGLGAALGGTLLGALGSENVDPNLTTVPIRATTLWVLVGCVLIGMAVAAVTQAQALPVSMTGSDREQAEEVRNRLTSSLLLPLGALVIIAALVALIGWLLLAFHELAGPLAIVVSAGVLLFAFLGGYRPNMRIRPGEAVAALAGIGVVVVIMALIAQARG